ncbi:MAG: hypothetical protein GX021_04195, partial [Tissierellia bacterium]|nr:hypothetical protein [Tissierellia bacterium]
MEFLDLIPNVCEGLPFEEGDNALSDDKKYYIQLNVPTEVNATKAGLDYHTYLSAMCQALSVDFPRLKKACQDK